MKKEMTATVPVLVVFLALLSCWCLGNSPSLAQTLPTHEVDALKKIAGKLMVGSAWDFNMNPCNSSGGWVMMDTSTGLGRNLTCGNCNTTNICHVVSIWLKGLNLTGVLPEEFGNLTSLTDIDLTYNYISGSIPAAAWASLPLMHLSLIGNRISGTIPKELGALVTLQELILDDNQLQGSIPQELGNLANLNRLLVSGNNLSGKLPDTLGNLKNLSDLRIDGNDFFGSIPTFIGNWTKLQRFDMQGTSLEGPFPSIFSTLESITELRISDLRRTDGRFPPLQNMSKMSTLVLRNCSISSEIPDYIGKMKLRILDLSFNNLTGKIPDDFEMLPLNYMYLTNNMLNGPIPNWILQSKQNIDVSHNTFTGSSPSNCQEGNVNMVASYSSTESNLIASCLTKDLPCRGKAANYEFFINCGGKKVTVNGKEYEDDSSQLGPSNFFLSDSRKWAYSSTGSFVSNDKAKYVASNTTMINIVNPELYMSARLSPASLRYYGLCLQKGNYTVRLHFAEIMFTDDQTYASVGKRFFDVSIQGQKFLKDFNIAEAANGTGREIMKTFTTLVNGTTLEILFQWAGKGTSLVPSIGVYGPLISAISVTPNFKPDMGDNNLPLGAILGIVAACTVAITLILLLLWFCLRRKGVEDDEFKGLELQTARFSLKQLKAATRNFDPANKIGEGGFGSVYKGILPDSAVIAIKQLSSKSKQGNREFLNEIGMISALKHPNLVKLIGFCIEGNQLLLVYEYMENNNLAWALFGPESKRLKLDWQTRRKICMGVARGLAFLHEESTLKIVHRDVKATNILLDKDLNAKISDFGLAKLDEEENTHISTRIAGTMGYMAPEYATRGYLTDKADVYSFGVVLLEIVSGMSNTSYRPKEDFVFLLDWAYVLKERGSLLELVDPNLSTSFPREEAQQTLDLALVCTNPSPTLRPSMTTVVSMLEGRTPVQIPSVKPPLTEIDELKFKVFERLSHDSQITSISELDGPWTNSSVSVPASKGDSTSLSDTSKLLSDVTYHSV